MIFSRNLGTPDRMLRFVIGAALMIAGLMGLLTGWNGVAIAVGAILVGTGFLNFCPIYRVFGFKTCSEC